MCTFKKIDENDIKNSISYIISTNILNKKEDFTVQDIYNDVKLTIENNKKNNEVNIERYIVKKLSTLMANGIVIEHGSYFSVKNYMCSCK